MSWTFVRAVAVTAGVGAAVAVALAGTRAPQSPAALEGPPATLRETGLYASWEAKLVATANLPFTPQYPLWTDGARKRRWIYLPAPIDATDPDAWVFPVGTKVWKEFSFGDRVETRFMMRTAAGWQYATYVWSADGREAVRAPREGMASVEIAPGVHHQIPSEGECRACHANASPPVLGFSALQLSTDRDPNAPHRELPMPGSVDLGSLVAAGLARGVTDTAPRIAGSPEQRAALGYLHGNCGSCHRSEGNVAAVGMVLAHALDADVPPAAATTVGRPSTFMAPALRVAPGDSAHSVVVARITSRDPIRQMPPLGTQLVDAEATRLIAAWIDQLRAPTATKQEIEQ